MPLPRIMPLMRSWAVLLVVIVFASVRMSSAAKLTADNADSSSDLGHYKIITRKDPLELKCSINEEGFTITWRKNGEEVKEGISKTPMKDGKETSTLKILKPGDSDAGTYECSAQNVNTTAVEGGLREVFNVYSYPIGSLDNDIIVVEGEKLTLDCQPSGVPTPKVSWTFGENNTLNTSTDRIKLLPNKNNVSNVILEIRDVKMSDRGEYKCVLSNIPTILKNEDVVITTKVRVKDKLAALWPFLGICAEVIVLCAIIFIYEKKRNKAELDESDTDNSPEQKNTPDHGKDSVRQRK